MFETKPKNSFEVTSAKMVNALLLVLCLFAIYKTYTYNKVANQLFYLQTEQELSNINFNNKAALQKFDYGNYCGWQITNNGEVNSSENYRNRYKDIPILRKKIRSGDHITDISICMAEIATNNNSVGKHIFGILFIGALLFILIRRDDDKKITKDIPAEKG